MKIHNLRVGHATNSSSSHSVVIIPPEMVGKVAYSPNHDDYTYNWEYFRLISPEDKVKYLAVQLYLNLEMEGIDGNTAVRLVQNWTGVDLESQLPDPDDKYPYPDLGIDHQSVFFLPKISAMPEEFMMEFVEWIKNDRVIVLGGNDNDDDPVGFRPTGSEDTVLKQLQWDDYKERKKDIRYKKDGDHWIIYDRRDGNKIRMTFDIDSEGYTKSITPELVDLKITDYCPFGCEFCYQASTAKGIHAPYSSLKKIIKNLADMSVFEVAIGGGEPTMHPDFAKLLCYAERLEVRPNFTTYSTKWLNDPKIVSAVQKNVGGIGVSIHGMKDIEKIHRIAEVVNGNQDSFGSYWDHDKVDIMLQHVLGSVSVPESIKLLDYVFENRIPLLLLGYKEVGFGTAERKNDMEGLATMLKLSREKETIRSPVSIDTAIVENYPEFLEALDAPNMLVSAGEGKFSMYWDAVTGEIGPSSYCGKNEMISLTKDYVERITTEFAKW